MDAPGEAKRSADGVKRATVERAVASTVTYSSRIAIAGSIRAALRAGHHAASSPMETTSSTAVELFSAIAPGAPVAPNAHRLLYAGFMAILAAGVGFSVRGSAVLNEWSREFGFTQTELGEITGGGLIGFGIIIILSSFIAEKVGYGKLLVIAFLTHASSAVLTLLAPLAYSSGGKPACFQCLFWGMFLFSVGNGVCEAVAAPPENPAR